MRVYCIVCGRNQTKPGAVNTETHGICETGICAKAWNDWMDMPNPKPELRLYYKALMAGRQDQGGKYP